MTREHRDLSRVSSGINFPLLLELFLELGQHGFRSPDPGARDVGLLTWIRALMFEFHGSCTLVYHQDLSSGYKLSNLREGLQKFYVVL